MTDLVSSSSYFLASLSAAAGRELTEDTMLALADVLPHSVMESISEAFETLEVA
jgi:hypothetical protein